MPKDAKKRKDKKDKKERREKDKKRKRHRSRTPSSSDASSDDSLGRRDVTKMAKRVERHLKKHGNSGGGFGYSNEDNPFGDPQLTQRFVWGKKIEKQLGEGVGIAELTARAERRRQEERLEEIEKVRRRREQREAERAAMAEELEHIQRERALAEAVGLERKEEEFHLEQARVRARQRLSEGRPKAIDLLTNNLFLLDGFDPTEEDPGAVIDGLNLYQLRELQRDVETYRELDARDASHATFWDALVVATEAALTETTRQEEMDRARVRGLPPPAKYMVREAGWHESLDADVAVMLTGKTLKQLRELEDGIREQLDSGEAADPEYWTAVLRRLHVAKARSTLREFHADLMERHLEKLRAGANLPRALTGGKDRVVQARVEAERAQADEQQRQEKEREEKEKEKEEEAKRVNAGAAAAQAREVAPPKEAGAAVVGGGVDANDEEIQLPEEEEDDEEEHAGKKAEEDRRVSAPIEKKESKPPSEPLDAELEALAKQHHVGDLTTTTATATAAAAAAGVLKGVTTPTTTAMKDSEAIAEEQAARGEPLPWGDLSLEERNTASSRADAGDWSPKPLPPEHIAGHHVIPEEEDARMLSLLREQVKLRATERFRAAAAAAASAAQGGTGAVSGNVDRLYRQMVANPRAAGSLMGATNPLLRYAADQAAPPGPSAEDPEGGMESGLRAAAARSMGDMSSAGDAPFGGEVAVDSQVYWWHEKHRPRKPKYFNRVHTGYDWNKYNKAHYDTDNPPPKVVQGYKFNKMPLVYCSPYPTPRLTIAVFYPDLIDPSKAPGYRVERDPNSEDGSTCLLRFSAGPPYEDIAFRIVNRDWSTDPKRGFKSTFERGILSLYFNFKREFYRR